MSHENKTIFNVHSNKALLARQTSKMVTLGSLFRLISLDKVFGTSAMMNFSKKKVLHLTCGDILNE